MVPLRFVTRTDWGPDIDAVCWLDENSTISDWAKVSPIELGAAVWLLEGWNDVAQERITALGFLGVRIFRCSAERVFVWMPAPNHCETVVRESSDALFAPTGLRVRKIICNQLEARSVKDRGRDKQRDCELFRLFCRFLAEGREQFAECLERSTSAPPIGMGVSCTAAR